MNLYTRYGASRLTGLVRAASVLLVSALAPVAPRAAPPLVFNRTVDVPSAGVRLALFSNPTETPLPSPKVFTYETRGPGPVQREERYQPEELWRLRQTLGRWTDAQQNVLILATVTHRKPEGFRQPHAVREEIDAALAKAAFTEPPAAAALADWVAAYTGGPVSASTPVQPCPMRFKQLLRLDLAGSSGRLAYAWQFNPGTMGQTGAPADWFVVVFQPAGDGAEAARRALETRFLGQVAFVPALLTRTAVQPGGGGPRAVTGRSEPKPGAGGTTATRSAEYQADRAQALDSIRNHKEWWYAETQNYILLSNYKRGVATLVDQIRENMELLRPYFQKCVPMSGPEQGASVIRVFATETEYLNYVGKDHAWSGGLWDPQRRELLVRPVEGGSGREPRDRLLATLYHEGFHQYLFIALNRRDAPAWFNEGHACLFEGAKISNGRLEIPEKQEYEEIVEKLVAQKSPLRFEAVARMSYKQFYEGTDELRRENYALAWALVYYLQKWAAPNRVPHAGLLERCLAAAGRTRDVQHMNTAALEGVDWKQLEADFVKFWKTSSQRTAARRNLNFGAPAAAPGGLRPLPALPAPPRR